MPIPLESNEDADDMLISSSDTCKGVLVDLYVLSGVMPPFPRCIALSEVEGANAASEVEGCKIDAASAGRIIE